MISRIPVHTRSIWLCLSLLALAAPIVNAQVAAETRRLVFQVSPLPAKGDLEDQVRQCLRGLRFPIVHLRAFVVGEGAGRVQAIVEREFKKRRAAPPALAIVVIGGLPGEGAQVILEAVSLAREPVNPGGVAFISGQPASSDTPVAEVAPLLEKSMAALRTAHRAAGIDPDDVRRVTCLMTSLRDIVEARRIVEKEYPRSALNFVQFQRTPQRGIVECETVARLRTAAGDPLRFLNPDGMGRSPNYSHIALVGARQVVFSGLHAAAGSDEADGRRVYEQLEDALKRHGASLKEVAMSSLYPVSQAGSEMVRKVRFEFYDRARPPASTLLLFDGLPVSGAPFAVDVIAVKRD